MLRQFSFRSFGFAFAVAGCLLPGATARAADDVPPPPAADAPPPPTADDGSPSAAGDGGEVLTRGPVHEAFAQPLQGDTANPLVVTKQPPAPIEEEPPAEKPAGDNVLWVSGYWAWDDDRKDFLWVSGIWRDAPPGQVWVSGYWGLVDGGFQWTAGFWTPAKQQDVEYLPPPPQSLDNGPNTAAPSENDVWVPGNFMYRETRYVWRPGFWSQAQANWIWVPAHYVWTPGGYVFVDGFWDYPLARRGVLFAPVYFANSIYRRPRFVYSPTIVIDSGLLTVNFFARPSYCHYYFGDYYDPGYARWGFRPWISAGIGGVRVGFGYDPLLVYYRFEHRRDPGWFNTQRDRYTYLESHADARPPRTYVQQMKLVNNTTNIQFTNINKITNNQTNVVLAAPLSQVVKNTNVNTAGGGSTGGLKFVPLSAQQRQTYTTQAATFRQISADRAKSEVPTGAGGVKGPTTGSPGSPLVSPTHKTLNLAPLVQATGGNTSGGVSAIGGPGVKIGPTGSKIGTGPSLTGPAKEPIGKEPMNKGPIGTGPETTGQGFTRPSGEKPITTGKPPIFGEPKTPSTLGPSKGPLGVGDTEKSPSTPTNKGPSTPINIGPKLPPNTGLPKTPAGSGETQGERPERKPLLPPSGTKPTESGPPPKTTPTAPPADTRTRPTPTPPAGPANPPGKKPEDPRAPK